jgi:hypothetical protein
MYCSRSLTVIIVLIKRHVSPSRVLSALLNLGVIKVTDNVEVSSRAIQAIYCVCRDSIYDETLKSIPVDYLLFKC